MRNMSFALTKDPVLQQYKRVTRRMGWEFLRMSEILQPVEKCMGLKPGETIVRLGCPIRVLGLRRERLDLMLTDLEYGYEEVRREGFAHHPDYGDPGAWVGMFCASHKGCKPESVITRIEFEYTEARP